MRYAIMFFTLTVGFGSGYLVASSRHKPCTVECTGVLTCTGTLYVDNAAIKVPDESRSKDACEQALVDFFVTCSGDATVSNDTRHQYAVDWAKEQLRYYPCGDPTILRPAEYQRCINTSRTARDLADEMDAYHTHTVVKP